MNSKKEKRRQFKKDVFARDSFKCVICPKEAVDAHHILNRGLWEDGGYHVDNGVSVCETCHLDAESGKISCDELREKADIKNILLPEGFDKNFKYDKWGNKI